MLCYCIFVIGAAGIFNKNGDGGADNHALVNGDTVAAYTISLSVKYGESDGLGYLINSRSGGLNVHNEAAENCVKGCAKVNLWGCLFDFKGGGARKVAPYGDGCCACVIVIFILQGAAVLGGVEGQAVVNFDRNVGSMGFKIKDKFSSRINIHLYGSGRDNHIVLQRHVLVVGGALDLYKQLVAACIGGSAINSSDAINIYQGHVLCVKSCGKAHADGLGIKIICSIKSAWGNIALGENCLLYSVGSGLFAGVSADALDCKLGCACACDIIALGICIGEVHTHHKLSAHNGDSHLRHLKASVVDSVIYGDGGIYRKVCALLNGDVLKVVKIGIRKLRARGIYQHTVCICKVVILQKHVGHLFATRLRSYLKSGNVAAHHRKCAGICIIIKRNYCKAACHDDQISVCGADCTAIGTALHPQRSAASDMCAAVRAATACAIGKGNISAFHNDSRISAVCYGNLLAVQVNGEFAVGDSKPAA